MTEPGVGIGRPGRVAVDTLEEVCLALQPHGLSGVIRGLPAVRPHQLVGVVRTVGGEAVRGLQEGK